MVEGLLPEYSVFNEIRQPAGSSLPGITPSNAYLCADGKYALIAGNGDSIFKRLMTAIGCPEAADNPDYANNDGRARHARDIDGIIGKWAASHRLDEEIGRASCRDSVCQYVYISGVSGSLKKK